jgi:hypothetical protein
VDYSADLLNLRTACKLKLPHLSGGRADKAATVERQNNKTLLTSSETRRELDRSYAYMPTRGLDAGGVTPELKLRLKFYCS